MPSIDHRLSALREYLETISGNETTFILEGGKEYKTREDVFDYLRQHGAYTPDGRQIVLYPHPVEGVDALSLSLYQLIDEAIERGTLELSALELESDMI